MRRALVTGGRGFIGRALCTELLNHDYEVTTFDRVASGSSPVRQIAGDVRDPAAVNRAVQSCDVVFHLAGVLGTCFLGTHVGDAVDANIRGAVNVFEAAKTLGTVVVNVGLTPEWLNAYMITKKAAMRFGLMYHQMFGTPIVTLEITHVYGPGQPTEPYRKAIPTFVTRALTDRPLVVYGSGKRIMDCVYIEDAARALAAAADVPAAVGQVLLVSSGQRTSVVDLATRIRDLVGSRSEVRFEPMRDGEPAEVSPDEGREAGPHARDVLGWEPHTTLDLGLRKTVDWYRSALAESGGLCSEL